MIVTGIGMTESAFRIAMEWLGRKTERVVARASGSRGARPSRVGLLLDVDRRWRDHPVHRSIARGAGTPPADGEPQRRLYLCERPATEEAVDGLLALLVLAVIVGLWIAFIYFTGQVAADRGHDPGVWYFAAVVLGPVALVAALAAPYTPDITAAAIARSLSVHLAHGPTPVPAASTTIPMPTAGDRGAPTQAGGVIGLGRWRVTESGIPGLERAPVVEVRVQGGRVAFVSDAYTHRTSRGQWRAAVDADGGLLLTEGSFTVARLAPIDGQNPGDAVSLINEDQ